MPKTMAVEIIMRRVLLLGALLPKLDPYAGTGTTGRRAWLSPPSSDDVTECGE
jgi:hypothetical protein